MHTVLLPSGQPLPSLGLGTWRMGESASRRAAEIAGIRLALELGYRVIDTAEMYGDGGAESVVGEAVAQAIRAGTVSRADLFVVSKVLPGNADVKGTSAACEGSLRRLGLDRIDLYLLHWRGAPALHDTVEAFESLRARGRIGAWGVSNFDIDDLEELTRVPGGGHCTTNQVYYSLGERGPGFALLPWMQRKSMPLMAYSPIDQGRLARHPALQALAASRGATPAQLALAWLMAQPGVMAIPKAVQASNLRENLVAAEMVLTAEDLGALDRIFPTPRRKTPLAMI